MQAHLFTFSSNHSIETMSLTPAGVAATAVILSCISSTGVGLRFFVRRTHKHGIKRDDWTILVGLVRNTGLNESFIHDED